MLAAFQVAGPQIVVDAAVVGLVVGKLGQFLGIQ